MRSLIACSLIVLTGFSLSAREIDPAIIPPDSEMAGEGPVRRYGWFTNLWKNKRTAWAKEVKEKQGALVFLGDSITQGWGDDFKGAFGKTKVANRGISGDTTRGMLYRMTEDVLALKPTGVVLLMGTNDLEEGATPEVIAGNLKLIIKRLKASNKEMPIILCNVFPSHESKKRSAANIKNINALYAAAVKGDPQVTMIDTWSMFADAKGNARKSEFPDLLHPNKLGYDMWTKTLIPVLETHNLGRLPGMTSNRRRVSSFSSTGKILPVGGIVIKRRLRRRLTLTASSPAMKVAMWPGTVAL